MAALEPRVPTSHGFPNIAYKPLDIGSTNSSIRLATLQPASREATIRMTLAHAAFAKKPKYEALSYTWGEPDAVKDIELNGSCVPIRENLWSALVSLRDAREERVLWIDAICINQADVEERSRQVQLMHFIFFRAEAVIVWLGTTESAQSIYTFEEGIAGVVDPGVVMELCNRPYWKRVWIVQEICAAQQLQVHWGAEWDSWDRFYQVMVQHCNGDEIDPAMKLFEQRRAHSGDDDNFLLATLMETYQGSHCKEPRDKVYGFVGIAYDCQDGSFPIDYSKSLFELYDDVVQFQYQSSKTNAKTIIHFSQLVQRLLGGPKAMLKDLSTTRPGQPIPLLAPDPIEEGSGIVKVTGVFGGIISAVGPSYDDFVGNPVATRSWKVTISKCQVAKGKLRQKNECFEGTLLKLDKPDLDTIHPIDPHFSWRKLREKDNMNTSELIPIFKFGPESEETENCRSQQPYLFATRHGAIGLMPHNAREGDLLFQFWNSDVVAVVRSDGSHHMRVIGRAVIANDEYQSSSKFLAPMGLDTHPETGLNFDEGVDLYIDIRTMQLLTQ
jgi:hypothetical protein